MTHFLFQQEHNSSRVDSATGTPIYFTMPPLEFDVFEPSGDTAVERLLIIYLHTGTFAPIIRNGNPTGSRTC